MDRVVCSDYSFFMFLNGTETSLIERFENIYYQTYPKLFGFVHRYTKEEQVIKDVLQDCYIQLWNKMDQVHDDEKLLPMLRTWAIHRTIDMIRKKARTMHRDYLWHTGQLQHAEADAGLLQNESLRLYQSVVNALPSQQRQVFHLIKEEGLSQKETADRLHISIHTVKRHLSEAMKTLRTKIPDQTLTGILLIAMLQSGIPLVSKQGLMVL